MNKSIIKKLVKIFMVVCMVIMIFSITNIVMWYSGNKRNETINEEIKKAINESNYGDANDSIISDITKLKDKNKDIVGYLKINNTNIDYVVVKGTDNNYYLKHNLYNEYNILGWIFMDYRNKLDGNDRNIVIYGHNIKSGSMFGTLKNTITKEWYENKENHIINLVLKNEVLTYQVFSTYRIKREDYYISTSFKNNDEFGKFVTTLKNRSVYDYNVDVDGDDSILTLSTCTDDRTSRVVLHAKLKNN